jgi:hypothetical protein
VTRLVPGARRLAVPTLLLACVASALVVVLLGTRLTFFNDDWYFLLQRPGLESHGGLDSVLAPHNSNLVALTALSYKLIVAVFGLGAQLPFRLLIAIVLAIVGVLVYTLVAQSCGRAAGLAAAAVVVLLGPAWEDLLFYAAAIDMIGSLTAGLGALLALQRDTPRRNASACVLLACSVGISNVGVAFVVGALIAVALRRRRSQLWIALVPAALFALWWAFDGSSTPSHLSASNIEHLPRYVFDSASYGLASLTGLNRGSASGSLTRGHVLLVLALLALVTWLLRAGRPPASALVPGGAALSFWVLTGASYYAGRSPSSSRYQLIDAVFLILCAAELLRGIRVPAPASAALLVLAAVVIWSNTSPLSYGYRVLQSQSRLTETELGALRLARGLAPPQTRLSVQLSRSPYLSGVTADRLFAESRAHGFPAAYSESQIARASAPLRETADRVLASAEQLHPAATAAVRPRTGCTTLSGEFALRRGAVLLIDTGTAPLVISVRRFGPVGQAVPVGFIAPRSTERLTVPSDPSPRPWFLSARSGSPAVSPRVEVCG